MHLGIVVSATSLRMVMISLQAIKFLSHAQSKMETHKLDGLDLIERDNHGDKSTHSMRKH